MLYNVDSLEMVEDTSGQGRHFQRSNTKAAAGTVQNLLSRFSRNLDIVAEDSEDTFEKKGSVNTSSKYQRTSTRAAPGTVRSLRDNFENK